MSLHRWISTDEAEAQCLGCGVVAPDFGVGVLADFGPLPRWCPGPAVQAPHHFLRGPGAVECAYCSVSVDEDTDPAEVGWECPGRDL